MHLGQIADKLTSLNRKIDILSTTVTKLNSRVTSTTLTIFSEDMEKQSLEEIRKSYREWKGDLLISYFIPKKEKSS